jgi:Na+-translocating ferredoxin:NAD+ oxidoreductase subunit B
MDDEANYQRLAKHLDELPGGFPPAPDGIELRILRRLFTPQQAELAVHLTLIPEEAKVIARRAGISEAEAEERLAQMALDGLIYRLNLRSGAPRYQATQFVIGIWEFQLNRLDEGLARDVEVYFNTMFNPDLWRRAPQLRTIPVGASLEMVNEVLPYEQAEQLVRQQKRIVVAPCICRKERKIVGEGCDKELETCLTFGGGAEFYRRNGLGREISVDEALQILETANNQGLVLQPSNSQKVTNICCCCGDCCGVLLQLKRHPRPADIVSSAFVAQADTDLCAGCGTCETRCQMDAISLPEGEVVLKQERCIGCGLCVSTCTTGALTLQRKPQAQQPQVPGTYAEAMMNLGRERGKLGVTDLAKMAIQSKVDRLLALRS